MEIYSSKIDSKPFSRSLKKSSEKIRNEENVFNQSKLVSNIREMIEKLAVSVISFEDEPNKKQETNENSNISTKNEGKQEIQSKSSSPTKELEWYEEDDESMKQIQDIEDEEFFGNESYFEDEIEEYEEQRYFESDFYYDSYFSSQYSDLDEVGESKESSFLNSKRDFSVKRSTNENKEERHRKNRWVNARMQRIQLERKSRKLSQVNAERFNSLTDFAKNTSAQETDRYLKGSSSQYLNSSKNKNQEDLELQKALQISARDYAQQAAKSLTVGIDPRTLADLLSRELTPEDYELLLLLDNDVKPKTIETHKVEELPKMKWMELKKSCASCSSSSEVCTICFMEYVEQDEICKLPCGHIFHDNCISRWLTSNSTKCPVDSLPVFEQC